MKKDLDICVCNPLTEKFTTFEILIQTSNPAFNLHRSRTRRRYNDFCWLKKILRSHHPLCLCPELPVKKKSAERFEVQFLVQRMKGLENWLNAIVDVSLYLSDTAVHLFLQTNLTCKQIDQYLSGHLPESLVQAAYRAATIVEHSDKLYPKKNPKDPGENASIPVPCPTDSASGTLTVIGQEPNLNANQNRADSGIAECESDYDSSSYESRGSSYSSSVESSGFTGKFGFPPVTEVTEILKPVRVSSDSIENVTIQVHNCDSDSCDHQACGCDQSGPSTEDGKSKSSEHSKVASVPPKSPIKVEMGVIFN